MAIIYPKSLSIAKDGNTYKIRSVTEEELNKIDNAITEHQDISGKMNLSLKGAAGGVAELDANGKVPANQLPSYVDDVVEYADLSSFPETGESGKIYVAINTGTSYRWSGSAYVAINVQDVSNKADKADTVLDTTLSRGRKASSGTGTGSLAFGNNVTASGDYSTAFGQNNVASGKCSVVEGSATTVSAQFGHAEGVMTSVTGKNGHAEGFSTTASNDDAHAEGFSTFASGMYSHAEGAQTRAQGEASHAEGISTMASDAYSHAEGKQTHATGVASHAEGLGTDSNGQASHSEGNRTIAKGNASHAEGYLSSSTPTTFTYNNVTYSVGAQGNYSHSEGWDTVTYGNASHAEGYGTKALAQYAHSEGSGSVAIGESAHAEGGSTEATASYAHAEGGGTKATASYAHSEGGGTNATAQAAHSEGSSTNATGFSSHAEGGGTTASGADAHAEGGGTTASGDNSHAEGIGTIAAGAYSHAEGFKDTTISTRTYNNTDYLLGANGEASHAEGKHAIANGEASHAEGYSASSLGTGSHSEGGYVYAVGHYSHAEGQNTVASGIGSHAEGSHSKATGAYSHAEGMRDYSASTFVYNNVTYEYEAHGNYTHVEGYSTAAHGSSSHAEGYQARAMGDYSHAEGYGALAAAQAAHAEGSGTQATGAQSHAEGSGARATNSQAHAEGGGTQATGGQSHAEGGGTIASGSQSHAEGSGAQATGAGSHAEGSATEASGYSAHAEGSTTHAIGPQSHAEGGSTYARDYAAHAEGGSTQANAPMSHAEGGNTIAAGTYSHVGGVLNVVDNYDNWPEWVSGTNYAVGDKVKRTVTDGNGTTVTGYICNTPNSDTTFTANKWTDQLGKMNYAEIIGNGIDSRSNARALDWDGNEYLAGDIYVGCNPDGTGGTKLPKDVQINGTSVVSNGVANIPILSYDAYGIPKIAGWTGIKVEADGALNVRSAGSAYIKTGTNDCYVLTPSKQHEAAFYGLAKAAGDTTQATSSNAVGYFTSEAKAKIWEMLGLDGSAFIASDWELINEGSATNETEANVDVNTDENGDPFELTDVRGVIWFPTQNVEAKFASGAVQFLSEGSIVASGAVDTKTVAANSTECGAYFMLEQKDGMMFHQTTGWHNKSVMGTVRMTLMEAMNSVFYPFKLRDKTPINCIRFPRVTGTLVYQIFGKRKRTGLDSPVINVSGTVPSITALPGHRYICGEVATLTITPPVSGCIDVVFESGSTPTVLTVPSTVKFPSWFDPDNLDANATYEINIMDGTLGAVMSWT